MAEKIISDHTFFGDYFESIQAYSLKKFDQNGIDRLRNFSCSLFPEILLKTRWPGYEMGFPRPRKLIYSKEIYDIWEKHSYLFLRYFFKKVEKGDLFDEYSKIIDRFGETIESRIGKSSGLHFNLEAAYWTFNIKFNQMIETNFSIYDCSLVCNLDEILARFDVLIRPVFFPFTSKEKIKPKKLQKLQRKMLKEFAPSLEESLLNDIWS